MWSAPAALFIWAASHLDVSLAVAIAAGNVMRRDARSASGPSSGAMKIAYPWYHTTDELLHEAQQLSKGCNGHMSMRTVNSSGIDIHVAKLRAKDATPVNRVFILFGEHSRELISPESGLQLLRVLCGQDPSNIDRVAALLKDNEFEMVLNGNPRSRRKVEDGDFCLRTNPEGVDLNRNWDEEWHSEAVAHNNANPGPHPFSEPETQTFKDLVTKFKPTTFLTVHSGTRGMYMPWAYDMEHLASRNQASMMEILKDIDAKHCECPYGAAGKEVGYSCPGTCLDWVYDKLQTPYSFAFEIYVGEGNDDLKDRWQQKIKSGGSALIQSGSHLGHAHFSEFFHQHSSDFVQTAGKAGVAMDSEACFGLFNPDSQDAYNKTVQNWAMAYLEMAEQVAARLRKDQQGGRRPGSPGAHAVSLKAGTVL